MQQLRPNTLLQGSKYKIAKVLGQGSFGITYLAEHTSLEKKVAIKEFFMKELNQRGDDGSITGMTEGSLSYNYARKFQKEAQNLARLEHPNIVRVTDSFEENGTFYYVMDYIEGVNLNDYVKNKVITEDEAVSIIKEVAEALIYMHDEKHMLHLDLKPGNVMRRNSDGHIYLIDFGLSKHYSDNGQPETSTTIGLGTAGYAPVEQGNKAKNGEFRPTIDVYALGATLYKLLTRETPPAASELVSDDELLVDNLKDKNVSQNLIDFVVKAMLPNVRKRIQTMKEFKDSIPSTSSVAKTTEIPVNVVKDEETETVDATEETELISNKKSEITSGDEAKYEAFNEEDYQIPNSYIDNVGETVQNASSGNASAMLAVGFMYLRGQGVEQNLDTAYSWFTRANLKGDYRARKMVAQWMQIKGKYKVVIKPYAEKTDVEKRDVGTTSTYSKEDDSDNVFVGLILLIVFSIIIIVGFAKGCNKTSRNEDNNGYYYGGTADNTVDTNICSSCICKLSKC